MGDQGIKRSFNLLKIKFNDTYDDPNVEKLNKVFEVANKAHKNQFRLSGEPYILHPLAVADILIGLKVDQTTIFASILHDTVEDTHVDLEDIRKLFGDEVALIVDGVTKLTKIEYYPNYTIKAENFRKLLLAISEDIRVLLVKLADRLHNMRTISAKESLQKQQQIATETLDIYAALAERIGIHCFKNELQEIAFSVLNPEMHRSITSRLSFLRRNNSTIVNSIEKELHEVITRMGINCYVKGREKTSYSIWRKMQKKKLGFEQLPDIIAFRVIVDKPEDCYTVLGILHSKFHAIAGEFKDYISNPKVNGYRSLHTVIMGPEKRRIEIQIRTREMHEIAEYGLAAHCLYKQDVPVFSAGHTLPWVIELMNILKNTHSNMEFIENTKLDISYNQVFCFTPKGDLISMPLDASALDFAFMVHTNVGIHCVGAKVNGKVVPLRTKLENGDQVEILCSRTAAPSALWEDYVVTHKAKSSLQEFWRLYNVDSNDIGRTILQKLFRAYAKPFKKKTLMPIVSFFKKNSLEDFMQAVGDGEIDPNVVVALLFPKDKSIQYLRSKIFSNIAYADEYNFDPSIPYKEAVSPVKACDQNILFGQCCLPIPGDTIVGMLKEDDITIHVASCDSLEGNREEQVNLEWNPDYENVFITRLKIKAFNHSHIVSKINSRIATSTANIIKLEINSQDEEYIVISLEMEVNDTSHLEKLVKCIKRLKGIKSIVRQIASEEIELLKN